MQAKSVESRHKNTAERENARKVAREILNLVAKGKNVSNRYAILAKQVERALFDGDIQAAKWIIDTAGEGATEKKQVDVTTDGKPLEVITGIRIVEQPSNGN